MLQTLTPFLLRVCRSVNTLHQVVLLLMLAAFLPVVRAAGEAPRRLYQVAAGDAATTLRQIVEQSGEQIIYLVPKVRGVKTNPVRGEFTAREVLDRMVRNTGLIVIQDERTGALIINRAPAERPSRQPPEPAPSQSGARSKSPSKEQTTNMKRKNPLAILSTWLALALAPAHAATTAGENTAIISAQESGVITGSVSNAATGAYLEGALVVLEPGNISVLTARDGKYTFSQVPPGEYRVSASYTGLDPSTVSVGMKAGATAVNDIGLTAEVYKLAEFVVAGEREGNALAIRQQENAPNVKNILSSDAFGNVADFNLGNFLQRVPGFSTEISEGEIVRVQIRGSSSDLSSVSIDGTRAANGATRTFGRGFDINTIPTEFIETIEVTKAATPDIDADSIGGAVNLKAKSALDRKGRRINYAFGHSYNWEQRTFRPAGNFGYSDLMLEGKLGFILTGSYNETHQPRNANGITWQPTTDLSKPAWFNADTFGQDQVKHTRAGLGLRLDYKLGDSTRLYFNTQYSYYYDQLNRRWGRLSTLGAANVLSVTDRTVDTRNQTFTFYQTLRNRDVVTTNVMAGGESDILGGKLDFSTNFSPSKGTDLGRMLPQRTVPGVGFHQERSEDHKFITLTQISGPDILDPRNSLFNSFDNTNAVNHDRILGAQINYKRSVPFRFPLSVKTGLRFRQQIRERDNTRNFYRYVGPDGVAGPVGAANDDNLARLFDAGYDYRPNGATPKHAGLNINDQFFNLSALQNELRTNPQVFAEDLVTGTRDTIRNDNRVTEKVSAAYLMGNLRLGRLTAVGGVRVEETRINGKGYIQEISPEEKARRAAWVGTVTPAETVRRTLAEYANATERSGQYRNFFPSVHFKYQITSNLLARASYSNGIGRPNFGSIIPTTTINNDTLVVTANNPELKPQYSESYDMTLEYYFRPAGLASIAVFEKRITDFIFRQSGAVLEPGNPFGDAYTGYTFTTDYNGGSARIKGLEVSFQQQFSNLPGFWKAFGAFANFTWQETKGNYGQPGGVTKQHELANFTPRGGNAGISYSGHPWTARILANHTGERLLAYSADPSQRQYLIKATPIDVSLAYALNRYASLYLDVTNLFNVGRQYQYRWIPSHRSDTWVYTTFVKFGVKGTF